MTNDKNFSRRNFLRNSSLGLSGGIIGASLPSAIIANPSIPSNFSARSNNGTGVNKLPREVCVASVDLKGLWPDTTMESRIKRILARMEEVTGMQPDIVCLPEMFDTSWVEEEKPLSELAE